MCPRNLNIFQYFFYNFQKFSNVENVSKNFENMPGNFVNLLTLKCDETIMKMFTQMENVPKI
jgi:hypothetical protein